MKVVLVVITALFVLMPLGALSSTWRVEQDGSGDFQVLQHALDATADGDTVLIGPGREVTFIGPPEFYEPPDNFAMILGCTYGHGISIQELTIEGAWDGLYWWQADLDMSGCRQRNCEHGVLALRTGEL